MVGRDWRIRRGQARILLQIWFTCWCGGIPIRSRILRSVSPFADELIGRHGIGLSSGTSGDGSGAFSQRIPGLTDEAGWLQVLVALGWKGLDAEWLALVCLHSGVFLRAQYLAFVGCLHPERARRFVRRYSAAAVEESWNGSRLRLCRIANVLSAVAEASQACSRLEHAIMQAESSALQTKLDGNGARSVVPGDLLCEPPRNGISAPPIPVEDAGQVGLKTVSVSAVDRGCFNPKSATKCVGIDLAIARPFLVRTGDASIVRGNGNRRRCSQAGLADVSYDDLVYPFRLIRLRFEPKRILPAFAVAQ